MPLKRTGCGRKLREAVQFNESALQQDYMKCIVLVDWTWVGHHPTFYNYFVLAFEELGYDVLALCPDPTAVEKLANATRAGSGFEGRNRGRTRFFEINGLVNPLSWLWPRRIGVAYSAIHRFRNIEIQAKKHARECNLEVGAIFYACIYERDFRWIRFANYSLRIPWSGLYLQAYSYRTSDKPGLGRPDVAALDRMFSGATCRSVGILDEGIVERMSKSLRKRVVRLPDLADDGRSDDQRDCELSDQLMQFASGRPIVGLFGHLQKSKGLLTLLKAAEMAEPDELCFALAGDVLWPLDENEVRQIRKAITECSNIWSHLQRIPTDAAFSHLIEACDVLAAAYVDFPHSSNILAKAAVFEKPVIVSDGFLMAERVRKFQTGEVINQEDAQGFLDAVRATVHNPDAWKSSKRPRWACYREEHSFLELKKGLGELVTPILE